MVSFLDWEGTDPASATREAAEAITKARTEVERRGIKSFLFHAASNEEFDQRAEFDGVAEVLDEVSDLYLGSSDQRVKLVSALRREFIGQSGIYIPRSLAKFGKDYSDEKRQEFADKGWALSDGSYPIADCGDVKDAQHRVGTGDAPDSTIKAHILKRWNSLGCGGRKPFSDDGGEKESKVSSRGAFAVCPTCEGKGSHVNPSIDAHGLSSEDFAEDPDFAEDYFSGAYDVPCAECGGQRVVPQCSAEGCSEPADTIQRGWGDRRDRVSQEHYPTCYEHHSDEDREDADDAADMYAEQRAEMRMYGFE